MIDARPFKVLPPRAVNALPDEISVWSQMHYDILQTLGIRIRLISSEQARRIWSVSCCAGAELSKCLDELVASELVLKSTINAHPLLTPSDPLAAWNPGDSELNWDAISHLARRRWAQSIMPIQVFAATKKTASLFGGASYGLPPLEHRDHDLLLADAYVTYRRRWPDQSLSWIGEDFLPKAGFQIKDPDAFIVNEDGHPTRVIESAGRYSVKQVANFHDHCDALNLAYELW